MTQNQAYLYSNEEPSNSQKSRMIEFLKDKHNISELIFVKDKSITAGFRLIAGSKEYDWTGEGRLKQFKASLDEIKTEKDVIPLIKEKIDNFSTEVTGTDIGRVITVSDDIATVSGLDGAEYGEILLFENGIKGLVQDLKEDEIGCILFDEGDDISQGGFVRRSGKVAGMPVGDKFIGRVTDALGNPIDGLGDIEADDYRPIERPAPGIVERQPVNTPIETGIITIDTMFPIGRGQRELIIGDRQTGKTTIAVDTILNQKDKDVICIYVAIGQKASSVASTVNTLKSFGAMDYTTVISSTAADPDPLKYIAPYAGCALGEYFMEKGKDVLIIYDDLSKHADAYRTLSLLLGRSPGREAYPGDIFYLHSRLLERSAHLSDQLGGGSLTAIPIVETQAGDVSAYIPTNVISITDGQIFLETGLFFSGQRPAVNVGISVSRVGGDAQAKIVKNTCKSLKIELAQYQEKSVFNKFSSDLDEETKQSLQFGESLMMIMRQKQHTPLSRHRIVIIMTAALGRKFAGLTLAETEKLSNEICTGFEEKHDSLCKKIDEKGILTQEETDTLKNYIFA